MIRLLLVMMIALILAGACDSQHSEERVSGKIGSVNHKPNTVHSPGKGTLHRHNKDTHHQAGEHEHQAGEHEHQAGEHEHQAGEHEHSQKCSGQQHSHPHQAGGHEHHHDNEGHDRHHQHQEGKHEHKSAGRVSLKELQTKKCEHGILAIECDSCRSELGVVKLAPQVARQLIKIGICQTQRPIQQVHLVGTVQVNPLRTVKVTPLVAGRVIQVVKQLGQKVKRGDLLAVIMSEEYGRAKLDYISATQRYAIAKRNLDWIARSHRNLRKLMSYLEKGQDIEAQGTPLKIGQHKAQLVEVALQYRMTKAKCEREQRVLRNIRQLLQILRQPNGLQKAKQHIKTLQIGEWKGKLLKAASELLLARNNYRREKALMQTKASTQKELQEAENAYQSAKASYQGLIEEVNLWWQQKNMELQTALHSSLARYQSVTEEIEIDLNLHQMQVEKEYREASYQKANAEKHLYLLGLSPAALQSLSSEDPSKLGILQVRAPASGTIIAFQISRGQFVQGQSVLYTISDLTSLWVWCDLYEYDLPGLQAFRKSLHKLTATVHLPDEQDLPARVEYLADLVDEKTRTVKIRLNISNQGKQLRPGMFVQVTIGIPWPKKALLLPEEAIFTDEGRFFVFKNWSSDYWVRHDIVLGRYLGNQREVLQGVQAGDRVVLQGGFMLKSEILKAKMGAG